MSAGNGDPQAGRDHLLAFMKSIAVVRRLSDFGLTREDCPGLAAAVQATPGTDPCDSSLRSLQEIYEASV